MLSQLEMEQKEIGGVLDRFLDLHMYITSALKKTDMKAVGLQMALDLLHAKVIGGYLCLANASCVVILFVSWKLELRFVLKKISNPNVFVGKT